MKTLVLMVGPQGAGKSTYCKDNLQGYLRISQDDHGKSGHMDMFKKAIDKNEEYIVVDRLNLDKNQRNRYLQPAKKAGYHTKIVWVNADREVCLDRCLKRTGHPSIDKTNAAEALDFFFKNFQLPTKKEADELVCIGAKPPYARVLDLTEIIGDRRHLIVGDIHGCLDELLDLLAQVGFNQAEDVLVCVGDLVDRGPKTKEVLEFVMGLPRFYSTKGNHDDKFVRYCDGKVKKLTHGLIQSIESFDNKIPKEVTEFLRKLPHIIKTPSGYCVHAGFCPDAPPEEQNFADCLYMRYYGGKDYFDEIGGVLWYTAWTGPRVFFGHIPDVSGPCTPHIVSLDGGCVFGDYLKAYDSKDGIVHYVNARKAYSVSEYGKAVNNKYEQIRKREEYAVAGMIRLDRTDDKKYAVYTYTDQCVFDRMWDEITKNSRGHIFDTETGDCVAWTFPKFFNVGENPESAFDVLPWDTHYDIYEKMDGWLGTLYRKDGKYWVASRGSFHSAGAEWASNFIQSKDLSFLTEDVTLVFEIINKAQKIILDYKEDTLVVLAAFNRHTGEEFPRPIVEEWAKKAGLPIVKKYENMTIHDCLKLQKEAKEGEGFVIRFKDGLRVKVKFDWYCQLAKMMADLSPISTWEAMKNGFVNMEFLVKLPEEIRPLAEKYKAALEEQYAKVHARLMTGASGYVIKHSNSGEVDRRAMALEMEANKVEKSVRSMAFLMASKQEDRAAKVIMDLIYPKANEFQPI